MKPALASKFSVCLRWVVGLLLVWASLSKLANLHEFYVSIAAYRMPLPDAMLRLTAIILPWLELLCGLLLLGKIWTRAALIWAMMMFAVFVFATGQAWARGLDIACGCFNLHAFGLGGGSGKWLVDLGGIGRLRLPPRLAPALGHDLAVFHHGSNRAGGHGNIVKTKVAAAKTPQLRSF